MRVHLLIACTVSLLLAACASQPPAPPRPAQELPDRPAASEKAHDVVIFALGLIDTGYRFGGKNPEAGLDCSGMVSYIYGRAAGIRVSGSAADIARRGRPIERGGLRPGDLVFFNTMRRAFSHVGIYLGDNRFMHAPRTGAEIRVEDMSQSYWVKRYNGARRVVVN